MGWVRYYRNINNNEPLDEIIRRAQEQAFKLGEASERAKTITVPEWMKDAIRKQARAQARHEVLEEILELFQKQGHLANICPRDCICQLVRDLLEKK